MKILQVTKTGREDETYPIGAFHYRCSYNFIIQNEQGAHTPWGFFPNYSYEKDSDSQESFEVVLNN
jgi:hypothetical protein